MQIVAELLGALVLIWLVYEGGKSVITAWRKKKTLPPTENEDRHDV